jgi:hypothetical protein
MRAAQKDHKESKAEASHFMMVMCVKVSQIDTDGVIIMDQMPIP